MKYKHFVKWCNERAADGQWSLDIVCKIIDITDVMNNTPFWKRNIVIPVNNEIKRRKENNNV